MSSDVSAVILTMGEPSTARALASVAAQTAPVRDVVVIEGVSPFHRAINQGARRVQTPFFVQVDSDMILDPTCIAILRGRVAHDSGIVAAELRDPLEGQVVGIKLFRTECFRAGDMPDSIAQDMDFGRILARNGWQTHYVDTPGNDGVQPRPTVGEHRPDYTVPYTFRKMLIEGARLRHRAARHGLFSRMGTLEQSSHPLALMSQVALGHGFFLPLTRDELRPAPDDPRATWLARFLECDARTDVPVSALFPLTRHDRLRDVYHAFTRTGRALHRSGGGGTFRQIFADVQGSQRDWRALVAKVGLAHSVMAEREDGAAEDERAFARFIAFSLGSRSTIWDNVRARAAYVARSRRRPRVFVPW
jgi:hypothetical protein